MEQEKFATHSLFFFLFLTSQMPWSLAPNYVFIKFYLLPPPENSNDKIILKLAQWRIVIVLRKYL